MIDLPSAVSNSITELLQKAHREIQEDSNLDVMERRASVTTTVGDPDLGTFTDNGITQFKEYGSLPFWTDQDGTTRFLKVMFDEGEARRAYNVDTTLGQGEPKVLVHVHAASVDWPDDLSWKVYPIPNGIANTSDGEYSIQVPYYRYLPYPSTNDFITDEGDRWMEYRATAMAFEINWDEARAQYWNRKAEEARLRLVTRDSRMRLSQVQSLVPYAGRNARRTRR